MSKIGRPLILTAMTAFLGMSCLAAQAGPFGEENAGLRCHYRLASDPTGVATAFVKADKPIRGYWRNASILTSRSLFFTSTSPEELNRACATKVATIRGAAGVVMIGAETSTNSYNYEIWNNGDIAPGKPVERIVSFGDSLSDTGNMRNESQWNLPGESWFLGRFSNGPTWVEYLAKRAGVPLNNWAIGGAQTRDSQFGLIHGIDRQIEGFFKYMAHAKGYNPARTLFTFFVSGNDFVNDSKTGPQIIEQQEKSLRTLVAKGARKILVVQLPDVSAAPVFRLGRTDAHTVLGKVDYYNQQITAVAQRVAASSGAEIRIVNSRNAFDQLLKNPASFGLVNAKDSCLEIDSDSSLNYMKKQKLRHGCDPAKYVFWDTLHPTTRTHELMADWAIEATPVTWGLRR